MDREVSEECRQHRAARLRVTGPKADRKLRTMMAPVRLKELHELPRDDLERISNATPFVASLGIRLATVGPGVCETELDVEPRHFQQNGFPCEAGTKENSAL